MPVTVSILQCSINCCNAKGTLHGRHRHLAFPPAEAARPLREAPQGCIGKDGLETGCATEPAAGDHELWKQPRQFAHARLRPRWRRRRHRALVVALHGCTQTADSYDQGTGWSDLADRLGFILVFPEQQPANNPKNCFSWFLPGDTARDSGEALSIRQMIAKAVEKFGVDRSRIFVTGLSAGGAMASVMLATYPEIFAGGAIIAGLPYGAASSVQEAFEAMFNERAPSSRALGDHVRAASSHRGPWPKISVWHGTADTVVRPSNADHIIRQWLDVQKLPERPSGEEQIGRHTRRVWKDANGEHAA